MEVWAPSLPHTVAKELAWLQLGLWARLRLIFKPRPRNFHAPNESAAKKKKEKLSQGFLNSPSLSLPPSPSPTFPPSFPLCLFPNSFVDQIVGRVESYIVHILLIVHCPLHFGKRVIESRYLVRFKFKVQPRKRCYTFPSGDTQRLPSSPSSSAATGPSSACSGGSLEVRRCEYSALQSHLCSLPRKR